MNNGNRIATFLLYVSNYIYKHVSDDHRICVACICCQTNIDVTSEGRTRNMCHIHRVCVTCQTNTEYVSNVWDTQTIYRKSLKIPKGQS